MKTNDSAARLIRIHPNDNVAVTSMPLSKGAPLTAAGESLTLLDDVEIGGRIALRDIPAGYPIIQ
ncbi:MAG: hypothetical protein B1H02_00240 [Candidatus Latescibacteria bacterium 4484_107]|nr:MAG: hypothetical protein B1H02_00240 [Candidatus Latescibacteria bacterium 4484_107]